MALSWQRWGNPVSDPGLDLVVARDWLHGVEPYRDVRYWYGPLGIGLLAGTFGLLGSSLAAAFAYGVLQTVAIAALCWQIAKRWLPIWVTAAAVGVVLAIGFSGSLFNFQLPHTASATTGLIALLLTLLAVAAGRPWLAGLAVGLAALTRPEFLAFAVVAVVGGALGTWRGTGRSGAESGGPEREEQSAPAAGGFKAAMLFGLKAVPGALLAAVPVLGWFAYRAGAERLFTENLFPVDFVRTVGTTFEQQWHPYDLISVGNLALRGVLVAGAAFALLRSIEAWRGARGAGLGTGRVVRSAAGPWLVWLAALAVAVAVAVVCGALQGDPGASLREVKDDVVRLLAAMTVLPAVAFAALAVGAVRWWQRKPSPLGGSWTADAALLAVAGACALRAYNEFSTDVYAAYYAAPAVLVAAILLWRGAQRLEPGLRTVAPALVLGFAALTLTAHAYLGRYTDQTVLISSAHGDYRAGEDAGPQIRAVVEHLRPLVREGEPMLVLPQEPGFHFLLGTRPALYDATFLPGTLHDDKADEAAARELVYPERSGAARRAGPPRYVTVASRRFDQWGFDRSGVDFNRAVHSVLAARYCVDAEFGDVANPPSSDLPAEAFTVLRLRADAQSTIGIEGDPAATSSAVGAPRRPAPVAQPPNC